MTHYLRFPDEATAMAALEAAGMTGTDPSGVTTIVTASHSHAIDVIGAITIGGTYDPETGEPLEPPTVLDGWHANFIGDLPTDWEQYVCHPRNPRRVFAGDADTMTAADGKVFVRARNADGEYVGDDPSTPDANEAWVEAS